MVSNQKQQIVEIDWDDIEKWVMSLSVNFQEYDVIVGVARAGVPIAVALSYACPRPRLLFAVKRNSEAKLAGYSELYKDEGLRLKNMGRRFFLDGLRKKEKRYLIVDDVATTGATMSAIAEIICKFVPGAVVSYAAFAVDKKILKNNNQKIAKEIFTSMQIDNKKVWVTFPWIVGLTE